jgi:6-phosphogluconolactonase
MAEVERPTWVLMDPARPVLYAVSEVGNAGDRIAEVLSFSVRKDNASLVPLSRTSSCGGGATHLALHPAGSRLFVANFGGGQVATLSVAVDGTLGAALSVQTTYGSGPHRRQSGPHAHGVTLDPSGRFLLVPDMGADRVFVYR